MSFLGGWFLVWKLRFEAIFGDSKGALNQLGVELYIIGGFVSAMCKDGLRHLVLELLKL